jgi:putative transposase
MREMSDYVHILITKWAQSAISIPPKYAVSQVVGYIKGKSAIHMASHWLCRWSMTPVTL